MWVCCITEMMKCAPSLCYRLLKQIRPNHREVYNNKVFNEDEVTNSNSHCVSFDVCHSCCKVIYQEYVNTYYTDCLNTLNNFTCAVRTESVCCIMGLWRCWNAHASICLKVDHLDLLSSLFHTPSPLNLLTLCLPVIISPETFYHCSRLMYRMTRENQLNSCSILRTRRVERKVTIARCHSTDVGDFRLLGEHLPCSEPVFLMGTWYWFENHDLMMVSPHLFILNSNKKKQTNPQGLMYSYSYWNKMLLGGLTCKYMFEPEIFWAVEETLITDVK